MFINTTALSQAEIKRLIRELDAEANFILANLCKVDNGHDALEEIYQLMEHYESKLCSPYS